MGVENVFEDATWLKAEDLVHSEHCVTQTCTHTNRVTLKAMTPIRKYELITTASNKPCKSNIIDMARTPLQCKCIHNRQWVKMKSVDSVEISSWYEM